MFKAPNIKGKRFRKNYTPVLNKDLFNRFIKAHPEHKDLKIENFNKIITYSSEIMWKCIIDERDGIELPMGGVIFIGTTKILVKNNYDIQASIKANTPIKHRNYDTDGHVAKIYYSPYFSRIQRRERSIWSFKAHRDFRRTVSKTYPVNWKKYIAVASVHKIARDYNKHKNKHYMLETTENAKKTYNEFDLD